MAGYAVAFAVVNALLLRSVLVYCQDSSATGWRWRCLSIKEAEEKCVRVPAILNYADATSLRTCQLICGEFRTLLPKPKMANLGKEVVYFLPTKLTPLTHACKDRVCNLLSEALVILTVTLDRYNPQFGKSADLWSSPKFPNIENHEVEVKFTVAGMDEQLTLDTDESYKLEVMTRGPKTTVNITAPTYFGARHALETMSQLVDYDEDRNSLQLVSSAIIEDHPVFPYRGIHIDTARNFLPVENIKRVLEAMSYNKLNTLHWHLTDTQSFPIEIKSYPKMSQYGAYSPDEVYTMRDVQAIIQYARRRGIRVLPELDAPSHVAHGWEWGEEDGLGKLVVCLDEQPWKLYCLAPPCGQMNIANPNLYMVLGEVYKELVEMFQPIDLFHYGGDEVIMNCWNSSVEIPAWMTENGFGLTKEAYFEQWGVFQEKARQLLTKVNEGKEVPGILWTSELTEGHRLEKFIDKTNYIIHIWSKSTDEIIGDILKKGYRVIFSNKDAWYMDCGVSRWVGKGLNCSPYKGWQDVYDNDIKFIAKNMTGSSAFDEQILGGEVTAWSEQIDENTIDAKLWPRGAALAERLWSNPTGNYSLAEHRVLNQRHRLVTRGIKAARLQPEWCRKNPGECRLQPWKPRKTHPQDCPVTSSAAAYLGSRLPERSLQAFKISGLLIFLHLFSFIHLD